ncbi:MarR family winged helix-turn-helix transcriptional regulator [Streptomyces odontomachi]|uniref:MarR family winged helix-turn-helix transcriptional regulator n=1 Tax=Streptomyces odontomachi TaxID=2944940 RepID=UPI0021087784|nr:MarR family transcriptional regulator [Streptomyces sp. ODS25]
MSTAASPDPQKEPERASGALLDVPVFALVRLGRLAHAVVRGAFADAGLSSRTHFVLLCLREDGRLSQRELADRVSMDRSDLVKVLDHLEHSGHLRREPDPHDRRRHLLSITPAGEQTLRRGEDLLTEATQQALAGLDAEQQTQLHRLTLQALATLT